MAIAVPRAASAAAANAVKGGAMMMSQCLVLATKGLNAVKNSRVSAWVLCIFQLPAMTGRRKSSLARGERFDAGKLLAGEKFQRSATPSGNVRDFLGNTGLLNGRYAIAAAHDRRSSGSRCIRDRARDGKRAVRKRGFLKHAERAVPDNCFRSSDFLAEQLDCLRTDVQAHPISGCRLDAGDLSFRVIRAAGQNVVHGQNNSESALDGFAEKGQSKIRFVFLDQ